MFLETSQNSQENTCARVSFLFKKRLWHRCFPGNFVKFLRTIFLQSTSGRLLSQIFISFLVIRSGAMFGPCVDSIERGLWHHTLSKKHGYDKSCFDGFQKMLKGLPQPIELLITLVTRLIQYFSCLMTLTKLKPCDKFHLFWIMPSKSTITRRPYKFKEWFLGNYNLWAKTTPICLFFYLSPSYVSWFPDIFSKTKI